MRIEDNKIIESFNRAVEAGHPDPVGFLARAEIKTKLDYDGEYKGAVGVFGVDKKQALREGFSEDELSITDGNLSAALTVDMNNYRKADGDVDEMYRMGNSGSDKGTDRFISKLAKERKKLEESLVFQDGQLVALSQPKDETEKQDGKTVHSETAKTDTAEDIQKQTQKIEFQQASKEKIDELLSKLVSNIVAETPINGV